MSWDPEAWAAQSGLDGAARALVPGHVPVLLREVLDLLGPQQDGVFADGTVGGGGHSEAILRAIGPGGTLYAIDRDAETLSKTVERLSAPPALRPIHGNFRDIRALIGEQVRLDGALLDLGVSSFQLDDAKRGFSYHADAPLDMRMDRSRGMTAAEWLAAVDEETLARALFDYADERWAARIAATLIRERKLKPLRTTMDLVRVVDRAIPAGVRRRSEGHPARRTFQAVRIAVNDEIAPLADALGTWADCLRPGGKLCVIAFHSIEDRVVKRAFRAMEKPCVCPPSFPVCVCGRKPTARAVRGCPFRPGAAETASNPRARSATLRAIEKLGG